MTARRAVVVADSLTITRFGLALLLVPASWTLRLSLTSVLVSVAWISDSLDGRIAQNAGTIGHLGRWDLMADTAVGAGLLIGLAGADRVPATVAVVAIIVFGAWFLTTGNFAASMLLQLTGYLPLLAILWIERPQAWWLPALTAVAIGIIDWRRLIYRNIPAFIKGITGFRDHWPS